MFVCCVVVGVGGREGCKRRPDINLPNEGSFCSGVTKTARLGEMR